MKKILILFLIILVVLVVWKASTLGAKYVPKSIPAIQEEQGYPVEVVKAKTISIKEEHEYLGPVKGLLHADIYGFLAEKVSKVHVKVGQNVRAGQTLYSLRYNPQTMLNVAQAGHRYAAVNFMRIMRLHRDGAATDMQLDQAKYALENASAQTANASKMMRIESPINGKVISLFLNQGDLASPMNIAAVIGRTDSIRVEIKVGEMEAAKLKISQSAEITTNALPGKKFMGEIYQINQSVDSKDKQYKIYIKAANTNDELRLGYMAKVKIVVNEEKNAVVVPKDIILKDRGNYIIYILENGKVKALKAELGISDEKNQQILNLSPDATIIAKGQHTLYDGAKVKVVEQPSEKGK
ncbi:MAG: efflux RND transporter periplasmic adaptor subunit [Candidatus Coatesbacteria bacterium]|nr:efflux RND transporter periplasmic adaptor subunit [Candidatus Coatesbacteria bacterium]